MVMSAEHKSKFAAFHRQWWRLHMSEKFSSGMRNSAQTNLFCYSWNIIFRFFLISNVIWFKLLPVDWLFGVLSYIDNI